MEAADLEENRPARAFHRLRHTNGIVVSTRGTIRTANRGSSVSVCHAGLQAVKYLSKEPMFFGYGGRGRHPMFERLSNADFLDNGKVELVKESGGPSHKIPRADKCPSGKHNLKLTGCWCVAESA